MDFGLAVPELRAGGGSWHRQERQELVCPDGAAFSPSHAAAVCDLIRADSADGVSHRDQATKIRWKWMTQAKTIEQAVPDQLERLERDGSKNGAGGCTLDGLVVSLLVYSWNQVFAVVDRLSRARAIN